MHFLRSYTLVLAIFFLAFFARCTYLEMALHAHQGSFLETISGADCYFVISENILAGHGYSCDSALPYELNSIRPPGQPLFLASGVLVGGSYWFPLILQILLGSAVPLLGMLVASYLTNRRGVILALGLLLALEPNGILFSVIFYSETLFTFLLLLAVASFFHCIKTGKQTYLYGSGVVLGLATLTKPTAEYIPVLFALVLLWNYHHSLRKIVLPIGIFALVFVLTLSPWLYRNYKDFGVAGVSPQLGEQLYAVLVPSVLSFEKGTTFQSEFNTILTEGGGVDPGSASIKDGSQYFGRAVPILLAHPKGLLLISVNTALNFFIHDGMIEVLKHVGVRPEQKLGKPALFLLLTAPLQLFQYVGGVLQTPLVLILVFRLAWIALTLLALVGVGIYIRREQEQVYAVTVALLVGYFMLTTLVIGLAVTARYRIPINALFGFFSVYGGYMIWEMLRKRYA